MMGKLGVLVLEIKDPEPARRALIMDNIRTADRPSAVGYFVLNALREWYQKYKKIGKVTMSIGHVEPSELDKEETRVVAMSSDWSGLIYQLVVAVERGDRQLLNDGTAGEGEF